MSNIPENCKYTKTHEWARVESDGTVTIGIDDFAQKSLGDMVFVELPAVGATVTAAKECGVVESVKSASDLYSPISGEVVAANGDVTATPALLNSDPMNAGWLFKVRPSNKSELDALMDAKTYGEFLAAAECH
jgi:glycine cleavage system H protein